MLPSPPNQMTVSAAWPAIRIAARSLNATPTTLAAPLVAIFSSSPTVVVFRLRGLIGLLVPPTVFTEGSSTQYISFPLARSNQLLPMIPFKAGTDPLNIAAWPGPVAVGMCA